MSEPFPRLLWLSLLAGCAPSADPDAVMASALRFGPDRAGEPTIGHPPVREYDIDGDVILPVFEPDAGWGGIHPVRAVLPARATEPFRVRDESSGLTVSARLADALDTPGVPSGGHVVYPDVLPDGADAILGVNPGGLEDWILFEEAPETSELAYALTLGDGVAGLRLVANTLEFLDEGGAPRLRVPPPFLVDAAGARHRALLAIEGCAVQTRPVAPWGRPVLPPGAATCTLQVAWDGNAVTWPAILDPGWKSTGTMISPRSDHALTLLNDDRVLVTGGVDEVDDDLPTAELYDWETGTWAATGDMDVNRFGHTSTLMGDWGVLIAGGFADANPDITIHGEIYSPAEGSFERGASMAYLRTHHTATLLEDGRVLLAGGDAVTVWPDFEPTTSVEIYDPVKGEFRGTGSLTTPRSGHDAGILLDGRVLVAGGEATGTYTEIYNPSLGNWRSAGNMATPRSHPTVTVLTDSDVIVAGGDPVGASADRYDPDSATWIPVGAIPAFEECKSAGLTGHTATLLADGRVIVAGGHCGGDPLVANALYDPATDAFTPVYNIDHFRYDHAAVLLTDGRVLVSGGVSLRPIGNPPPEEVTDTCEVLTPCLDDAADDDSDGVECANDCDDADGTRYPGAEELCDGLDNDCDGDVPADEVDVDADGWLLCNDCDDRNATYHPEATELCDGFDQDCDGVIPDDEIDADGDWWKPCQGDCDDTNPNIKPAQAEVWGNGVDDNCDGYTDPLVEEEPDDEGCNCAQHPRSATWPWTLLGALGLALVRRQPRARRPGTPEGSVG